jgi:hypothetical protein
MCVYVSDLFLYFISHADTRVFDKLQPWKQLKKILCLSPCCGNRNKEVLTFYKKRIMDQNLRIFEDTLSCAI